MSAAPESLNTPESIIPAALRLYAKYGRHGLGLFSAEAEKEMEAQINNLGDISIASFFVPGRFAQELTPEGQARLTQQARSLYNLLVSSLPDNVKPAPLA
ncbi:hypothetical protein D9M72_161660 [compost metagenome]